MKKSLIFSLVSVSTLFTSCSSVGSNYERSTGSELKTTIEPKKMEKVNIVDLENNQSAKSLTNEKVIEEISKDGKKSEPLVLKPVVEEHTIKPKIEKPSIVKEKYGYSIQIASYPKSEKSRALAHINSLPEKIKRSAVLYPIGDWITIKYGYSKFITPLRNDLIFIRKKVALDSFVIKVSTQKYDDLLALKLADITDEEKVQIQKETDSIKQLEKEKIEQAKLRKQKLLEERITKEKAEAQKLEQEKLEQERIANEKAQKEKLELEKLAKEKAEQERLKAEKLAEQKRLEEQKLTKERLTLEKLEAQKLAEKQKLEEQKLAQEKAEAQKLAQEKLEQERIAKEKAEQERLEAEKLAEQKRLEEQKLELEKLAKEKAEQERLEAEKLAEKQKLEEQKIEQEKIAKEKAQKELEVQKTIVKEEKKELNEKVTDQRLQALKDIQDTFADGQKHGYSIQLKTFSENETDAIIEMYNNLPESVKDKAVLYPVGKDITVRYLSKATKGELLYELADIKKSYPEATIVTIVADKYKQLLSEKQKDELKNKDITEIKGYSKNCVAKQSFEFLDLSTYEYSQTLLNAHKLKSNNQISESIAMYEKAFAHDQNNLAINNNLFYLYGKTNNYPMAMEKFCLLRKNIDKILYSYTIGALEINNPMIEEELVDLLDFDKSGYMHLSLAVFFERNEQFEKSHNYYKKAYDINRADMNIAFAYARSCEIQSDYKQALFIYGIIAKNSDKNYKNLQQQSYERYEQLRTYLNNKQQGN